MKKHLQSVVVILVLLSLIFFLASLYSFIFEVEYNKCEMTYMMQYPEYIPVELPSSVQRKFPHYNLYVYTEGHSEPVRRRVYEGVPLLFIPGNDGSYKQVRSLASVAIQMRKSLHTDARFDCFAVDMNSEFSALHGPFLYRQSDFVKHVVDHIESLYPSRPGFSVILVGHSMGGLVARHAMTLDGFDRGRVPLIVTLATPHQRPVLNTDSRMNSFYSEMNSYWRRHQATSLGHIALVSIGGGDRDIEVALGLTRLDGLALPRNSVWASASHVRDAWASTDHRCIVWCKQLVIALCRALFSVAFDKGLAGGAASTAAEFRRRLLPATPLSTSAASQQPPTLSKLPEAENPSRWYYRDLSDPRQRSFRFERDRVTGQQFIKILAPSGGSGLLARSESAVFLLDGSNTDSAGGAKANSAAGGWLFACLDPPLEEPPVEGATARNVPCKSMARLDTVFGRDLPPSGLHRRFARLDAGRLDGVLLNASAFVVVLGPASEPTELNFDLRTAASRSLRLDVWSLLLSAAGIRLPAGSLYAAARLSPPAVLSSAGRGLEVTLVAHKCQALVGAPGSLVQETPAAEGGYAHAVQYFNQNASLALADCGSGDCRLHVLMNPLCEHSLSVRFRPQQFGAALLRESGDCLPTWVGLQVLSAVLSSLVHKQQQQPSLFISLTGSPLPLLTSAIAALPAGVSSGGSLGALVRQLCTVCLALPFAVALLLAVASAAAWISLLMRAPRLLLPLGLGSSFANFLSPFGCILALYMTQCHCAAAGIVFLLVTQLLKTAAARLNSKPIVKKGTASGDCEKLSAQVGAEARILEHHSALAAVCALLACLCGPSLFVWAKTLQQQQLAAGSDGDWWRRLGSAASVAPLPVGDPHYPLGVAFAVLYAIDSALLASAAGSRFYAPPLTLSWPVALGVSVLMGSAAALSHGNYALHGYLVLLLFGAYTLARCVECRWLLGTGALAAKIQHGPKLD